MGRRAAVLLAVLLASTACGGDAERPPGDPPGPGPSPPVTPRVLVVTRTTGFRHDDSIRAAESAFIMMSSRTGPFQIDFCRDDADVKRLLTPGGLSLYAVVVFAYTTGNIGIPDLGAFLDWIRAGHGFVGIHSASDTYHDEPAYLAMLGGEFETHGAIVPAEVRVRNPHPAVSHLAPGFQISDEFYRFTRFDPSTVTVVLALDRNPGDGVGNAGSPADLPLAWHRSSGSGRVFYTALGHPSQHWGDPRFTQHIREAIRWAAGQ